MDVARTLAEEQYPALKEKCKREIVEITKNRSDTSIPALLPDDIHPVAAVTCVSIAIKRASDRVLSWLEQNLTIGT